MTLPITWSCWWGLSRHAKLLLLAIITDWVPVIMNASVRPILTPDLSETNHNHTYHLVLLVGAVHTCQNFVVGHNYQLSSCDNACFHKTYILETINQRTHQSLGPGCERCPCMLGGCWLLIVLLWCMMKISRASYIHNTKSVESTVTAGQSTSPRKCFSRAVGKN